MVDGSWEHLRDRALMNIYVKAYNAGRKHLAAEATASRGKTEAGLAAAERAYNRAYRGDVRGFISEDEDAVTIPALCVGHDGVRGGLASRKTAPTVPRLHPSVVATDLAAIDRLDGALELDAAYDETSPAWRFANLWRASRFIVLRVAATSRWS